MKKLLLLLLIPFILTGCFGGDDSSTTGGFANPNYNTYDNTAFTISYPKDWEVIDSKSFTSNVPAETLIDFRNNIKNEIFTANTNISQSKLPLEITSADFGKSTLLK